MALWAMADDTSDALDTSCLLVNNLDSKYDLEVWSQSLECYKCEPWKMLMVNAASNDSLSVNSTYPTELFFKQKHRQNFIYGMTYHFTQHGLYSVNINSSYHSQIETIIYGNNEYMSLLYAFLFYSLLYIVYACTSRLMRRRSLSTHFVIAENQLIEDNQMDNEIYASDPVEFRPASEDLRKNRLKSLDTFRGLSIVLMIFVNFGGGKFYFFRHAKWNGLTVADLVFPWFLWIMGVSLVFSFQSQVRKRVPLKFILLGIFRRSIVLFLLGIIINSIKSNYLPTFRIPGVLQRFAICYLLNASIELFQFSCELPRYFACIKDLIFSSIQWFIIGLFASISLILTFQLGVPGCPKGYLGPGGAHMNGSFANCTGGSANYVDKMIFGINHIHKNPTCKAVYDNAGPYDPEGFLGTLMSLLTVQLGVAAGRIIVHYPSHSSRLKRWFLWAITLGLLGGCLCGFTKESGVIPLNKNLWSLSYVFVTSSFAFLLLTFLYFLIDVRKIWSENILRIAGLNAILLYMGHEFTCKMFPFSWSSVGESHSKHLIMNLTGTSLWILIALICHSKEFYISI